MATYYVKTREDGKEQGPFNGRQLKQLADSGKLKPKHLVSVDQNRWVAAANVKGLLAEEPDPPEAPQPSEEDCARLHDAIEKGEFETVASLVREFPEIVNTVETHGMLPLQWALDGRPSENENHMAIAKLLFPDNELINHRNQSGYTALHLNALFGDTAMAKALLQRGAEVNRRNPNDGSMPLHLAAMKGQREQIEFLLQHGAELNAREKKYGLTPLHFAAVNNDAATVRLLLSKGADTKLRDKKSRTALNLAEEHRQPDTTRILREYREEVAPKESTRQDKRLFTAVEKDAPSLIRSLLANGADPDTIDESGESPLHAAARSGKLECCKALLDGGADPYLLNDAGQSPVACAEDFHKGHANAMAAAFGGMIGNYSAGLLPDFMRMLRSLFRQYGKKKKTKRENAPAPSADGDVQAMCPYCGERSSGLASGFSDPVECPGCSRQVKMKILKR